MIRKTLRELKNGPWKYFIAPIAVTALLFGIGVLNKKVYEAGMVQTIPIFEGELDGDGINDYLVVYPYEKDFSLRPGEQEDSVKQTALIGRDFPNKRFMNQSDNGFESVRDYGLAFFKGRGEQYGNNLFHRYCFMHHSRLKKIRDPWLNVIPGTALYEETIVAYKGLAYRPAIWRENLSDTFCSVGDFDGDGKLDFRIEDKWDKDHPSSVPSSRIITVSNITGK